MNKEQIIDFLDKKETDLKRFISENINGSDKVFTTQIYDIEFNEISDNEINATVIYKFVANGIRPNTRFSIDRQGIIAICRAANKSSQATSIANFIQNEFSDKITYSANDFEGKDKTQLTIYLNREEDAIIANLKFKEEKFLPDSKNINIYSYSFDDDEIAEYLSEELGLSDDEIINIGSQNSNNQAKDSNIKDILLESDVYVQTKNESKLFTI